MFQREWKSIVFLFSFFVKAPLYFRCQDVSEGLSFCLIKDSSCHCSENAHLSRFKESGISFQQRNEYKYDK